MVHTEQTLLLGIPSFCVHHYTTLLAVDVATAKNLGVENVLRIVSASNVSQEHDTFQKNQAQTRCYSPSSVADFAYFR